MNIITRVKAPTPKFFKVLRTIGMGLAAIGGIIVASPIALPVVLGTIGGYIAVAGSVLSVVSQFTTINEATFSSFDEGKAVAPKF
ncbi:hypothetical protein [Flavobacterium sp. GSP14]|uniref:hypothetical protein n=1 Tax=Flavobacterium sp. GSP14 TaxID=3401734 RepID=UPI003AAE9B8B